MALFSNLRQNISHTKLPTLSVLMKNDELIKFYISNAKNYCTKNEPELFSKFRNPNSGIRGK
jgi:hypothetical protein